MVFQNGFDAGLTLVQLRIIDELEGAEKNEKSERRRQEFASAKEQTMCERLLDFFSSKLSDNNSSHILVELRQPNETCDAESSTIMLNTVSEELEVREDLHEHFQDTDGRFDTAKFLTTECVVQFHALDNKGEGGIITRGDVFRIISWQPKAINKNFDPDQIITPAGENESGKVAVWIALSEFVVDKESAMEHGNVVRPSLLLFSTSRRRHHATIQVAGQELTNVSVAEDGIGCGVQLDTFIEKITKEFYLCVSIESTGFLYFFLIFVAYR